MTDLQPINTVAEYLAAEKEAAERFGVATAADPKAAADAAADYLDTHYAIHPIIRAALALLGQREIGSTN